MSKRRAHYDMRKRKPKRIEYKGRCEQNEITNYICSHEYYCPTRLPLRHLSSSNTKVESLSSEIKDNGLFSAKKIDKKGIVIMNHPGKDSTYSLKSESGQLIHMDSVIAMVNHSCKPNCKMMEWSMEPDVKDDEGLGKTKEDKETFFGLVALKTIHRHIEITFDYGLHRHKDLANSALGLEKCLCCSKKPSCRGLLGSKPKM